MTTATDAHTGRTILDLATGAWRTQALYTAVRLRLPDHVAAGHSHSAELAEATGAEQNGLRRLMRLLCALEVFGGDEDTGYRETAVSAALRSDNPESMRDLCLLYGEEFYQAWAFAEQAVNTERPSFACYTGSDLFTYLQSAPDAARRFQRAMNAGNVFFDALPEALNISGPVTVVDVGGGNGQLLATLLRSATEATGILVERNHMIPLGRDYLERTVGLERVRLDAANIFDSVPTGGDVYLLSRVLQDWDDETCVRLLENCRQAMQSNARLVLIERVIPETGKETLPQLWDLHLLIMSGGRERTLAGYRDLLERAGFQLDGTVPLPVETSALLASCTGPDTPRIGTIHDPN